MSVSPLKTLRVDALTVQIYESPEAVALAASNRVGQILNQAIEARNEAIAIFATGRSQVQFLDHITSRKDIRWNQITGFHLDEYLGISATHPASFRDYLNQHLVKKVDFANWYGIAGDAQQPLEECDRYGQLLQQKPADLCCLGVGNNGHLAFNDPSVADFCDRRLVKLVRLDEQNRQQQIDSTSFKTLADVPQYAFTLTIPAILEAQNLLCLAYGNGKASIVHKLLTGAVDTQCPASILRRTDHAVLLLDTAAASDYEPTLSQHV